MIFLDLPEVIFYLLQGYLSSNEFRNIFNCSKYDETMMQLKKKLCVYHLNEYYSSLYFSPDGDFKSKLLSLIEDPRKQLGINCRKLLFRDDDDSEFSVKGVIQLSQLQDIYSLRQLDSQEIWDDLIELQDLSFFSSSEYLDLVSCTSMVKLQGLISIRELRINNSEKLSDISSLSNCLHLTKVVFNHCYALEDINALAHVRDIEISNCPITDQGIAQLGQSLKRLKLCKYNKITSVDHLLSLENLFLEANRKIESIDRLFNLKDIEFVNCSYLTSYPNSLSLKTIKVTGCPNLLVNYSESFPLKAFSYRKKNASAPAISTNIQINLLSMKECWKSIAILRLHFHMPTDNMSELTELSSINILAEINSLRKLDLYHILDKSLDIHLFQQIVWLSINNVVGFTGITMPMPNLRTLKCPYYPLSGLFSSHDTHRKLNLQIAIQPELIPMDIYELSNISTLRIISSLVIPQDREVNKNKKIQKPLIADTPSATCTDSGKREILLQLDCAFPAQLSDLTTTFSRLRVLILYRFSDNLVDLSELALAGIDKIPILAIAESRELKSLYPPHVTPTHEHLYLDDCPFLGTLGSPSSLRLISVVSIRKCAALKDVRGLHGCQEIRLTFPSAYYVAKGLNDIVEQLEPFIPLKEIQEVQNPFLFEHSHRLYY